MKLEQHSKQLRAMVTAHRPLWKIWSWPKFSKKKKKAKWISKNTSANAGPMLTGCLVKYFHRKQAQAINFAITMHVVK